MMEALLLSYSNHSSGHRFTVHYREKFPFPETETFFFSFWFNKVEMQILHLAEPPVYVSTSKVHAGLLFYSVET